MKNQKSSSSNIAFRLRALLSVALPILLTLTFPLMTWKALSIMTASPSPVMCVISESMAPAFHRGDLIFLSNRPSLIHAGDIPVVWFTGNPYPMVHRAVQVYSADSVMDNKIVPRSFRQFVVTKGDNNEIMDVPLYPPGREYVLREEIVGFVRGYVPLLGWVVIALQEFVWIKYLIFGLASCSAFFN
ncbi:Signal peptidase complex catalytic subunit sec11 [Talaromyces pinophilus]|nr:Signal peptidase complex catalytic subunit sec11 [Talaromyces pinophilus]